MSKVIKLEEGSEEFKEIKKDWQSQASKATVENLPVFLKELTENYEHDYGTICHATALAAKAAARAIDASPQGGITGFQAGCIMWQFIKEWNHSSNRTGLKLVDYDNFLYPQYEDHFDKTIDSDIWASIQKEATKEIEKANKDHETYLLENIQYEKDVKVFVGKYPDYYENKKHYDPLGMGNGEQWEVEKQKKLSGFEFAPQPPYRIVEKTGKVYRHWQSIVAGSVPFGYTVSE